MFRKTRSDCTVGSFEKKHSLPAGTIRNRDGRDTRSDKLIGTIRKEAEKLRKKYGREERSMQECENCGHCLDDSIYFAPWEDDDNEYGFWICSSCRHKNIDWASGDD